MAAVTINSQSTHVAGDLAIKLYDLTFANTNTLDTKLNHVLYVGITPKTVAEGVIGYTISGSTITFATGGTITAARVMVVSAGR